MPIVSARGYRALYGSEPEVRFGRSSGITGATTIACKPVIEADAIGLCPAKTIASTVLGSWQ